jgi:hypothetical protein
MTRGRHTTAVVLVALAFVTGCGGDGGDRHDDADGPTDSVLTQRDALAVAVRVEATGCAATAATGAGSFIAHERVITVAHVVAGSTRSRWCWPTAGAGQGETARSPPTS